MDLFLLLNAEPRLFAIDQQTFVQMGWVLLNACVLAFILSKLLYKPVLNILNNRKARIEDDVESAKKSKAEALQLKSDYEQRMKDIAQEKDGILEAARKLADDKSKEQMAEAKSEVETLKNRAHKEIEMEQERAKAEMKQAVINVSTLMATKFLSRTIDAEAHEKLFEETMAELEGMTWHN